MKAKKEKGFLGEVLVEGEGGDEQNILKRLALFFFFDKFCV